MTVSQNYAFALMLEALKDAQQALIHSEPKAKHYPEPLRRHEDALKSVSNAILRAGMED